MPSAPVPYALPSSPAFSVSQPSPSSPTTSPTFPSLPPSLAGHQDTCLEARCALHTFMLLPCTLAAGHQPALVEGSQQGGWRRRASQNSSSSSRGWASTQQKLGKEVQRQIGHCLPDSRIPQKSCECSSLAFIWYRLVLKFEAAFPEHTMRTGV